MKLSKTSWLLLTVGISAILGASLGLAYLQQAGERSRLEQELSAAQLQFDESSTEELSSQQEKLERRLVQAELGFKTAEARLSQPVESIETSDALFVIAEHYGVEITDVSSSTPTDEQVDGVACCVLPLTVQVEGDVNSLIDFVINWAGEYSTGVVKSVEMTVPQLADVGEEGNEAESEEETRVNIRMLIYTYVGD